MAEVKTPAYIRALVRPSAKAQPKDRKVWGIGLETVWVPFFLATNAMNDTRIPPEDLVAPMRLAHEKDGTVRQNKAGEPVRQVVKAVRDAVGIIRQNTEASYLAFAAAVHKAKPEAIKAQLDAGRRAAEPILSKETEELLALFAEPEPEPEETPEAAAAEAERELVAA